jgi:hypothetical protein
MTLLGALAPFSTPALADQTYSVTVHDGGFQPSTLQVQAGVKFKLTVTNATSKSAEFESAELNREKVIPAGSSAIIYIGPLAPGSYPFFDDFDAKKHGQIVAK